MLWSVTSREMKTYGTQLRGICSAPYATLFPTGSRSDLVPGVSCFVRWQGVLRRTINER